MLICASHFEVQETYVFKTSKTTEEVGRCYVLYREILRAIPNQQQETHLTDRVHERFRALQDTAIQQRADHQFQRAERITHLI